MKYKLVLGAGGFIGNHMVNRLKAEGHDVIGIDLKNTEFSESKADIFHLGDLTEFVFVDDLFKNYEFSEIYQYAADMGGAGYIFTGENDANVMHNSSLINLNILKSASEHQDSDKLKIFYSSSACIYPESLQLEAENVSLRESDAYPANPDSEYGWEKLFSERLYFAFNRNYGLDVRVGRYHNIYGPYGTWTGGKEKAPAAMCRKVAESDDALEVWGDGSQTRSFMYIDDCVEATLRFMRNPYFLGPVNIGSEEMVTINQLAEIAIKVSGKNNIGINNIFGDEFKNRYGFDCPIGVAGRNSSNELYCSHMNWSPSVSLVDGMKVTYDWIKQRVDES